MITRIQPGTRLSHAVAVPLTATLVMTAGDVADDTDGDVTEQTRDVLAKIDANPPASRVEMRLWRRFHIIRWNNPPRQAMDEVVN